MDRAGVERWRVDDDAAGIRSASQPPAELVAIASSASVVLVSDLPRATESAARLASVQRVLCSPLLRELPLAVPAWPTRLPLAVWGTVIYLHWQYRRLRGEAPSADESIRISAAAAFITNQVAAEATCVVVTHGAFRKVLAAHLRTIGWHCTGRRGGDRPWSAWTFKTLGRR